MERRDQEEEELDRLLGLITVDASAPSEINRQRLFRHNNPPESVIPPNPTFPETILDWTLENSLAHLNISTPLHQSPFLPPPPPPPVLDSFIGGRFRNPIIDSSSFLGLSPSSFQEIQQNNMELQWLRNQESVARHMAAYLRAQASSSPSMGTESLGSYNLSRLNSMSRAVTDDPYWNLLNGVAPAEEINDCASSNCRCYHKNESRRYPIRPCSNRNGFRFDSERSCRGRSICGMVSGSENSYMRNLFQKHSRHLSLADLRGQIVSMAKNQHGYRFLQRKLHEGNAEEIEMIFSEVKDHIVELMLDQFGNYFVQKLLAVCNEEQMTLVLLSVTRDGWEFIHICLDTHGTRAVQKLLEHLTTPEQISRVMLALSLDPISLTKHPNGQHVIKNCLEFFSAEDNKYLLNAVADNCVEIAKDQTGCCLLKQCVQHARGELRERFMAEITANAPILAEDPFGNYVVQYILELQIPHVTADLLRQLEGRYAYLSMDKYGSNVVETCFKISGEEQSTRIIKELINSPGIFTLIQDPFGNYVIQRALEYSTGPIYNFLVNQIQMHSPSLRCHPFGRRVLDLINRRKKGAFINMYNVGR